MKYHFYARSPSCLVWLKASNIRYMYFVFSNEDRLVKNDELGTELSNPNLHGIISEYPISAGSIRRVSKDYCEATHQEGVSTLTPSVVKKPEYGVI